MADGALSIKLRCASWQQLATIYKRDLSQGTMFLKASAPPAVGTAVRIDLSLPSATVIALSGMVHSHINDPQRGSGVELKLAPIPASTVWLIESALASEHKRMATPFQGLPALGAHQMTGMIPTISEISEAAELAAAEQDLIKALVSEAESLKKLNPFLVLGVGYEATDSEVRAAFGELTKRYHPDRFARYESSELRQVAAEIFILIRDAYRRLADATARASLLASLGKQPAAPRAVPGPPRQTQAIPPPRMTQRVGIGQLGSVAARPDGPVDDAIRGLGGGPGSCASITDLDPAVGRRRDPTTAGGDPPARRRHAAADGGAADPGAANAVEAALDPAGGRDQAPGHAAARARATVGHAACARSHAARARSHAARRRPARRGSIARRRAVDSATDRPARRRPASRHRPGRRGVVGAAGGNGAGLARAPRAIQPDAGDRAGRRIGARGRARPG